MKILNGYLMSADQQVAAIENNNLKILQGNLLPLYFRRNGDLLTWIKSRAIDSDRVHSRLLKKALQLPEKDDLSVVMTVRAACITDNYWIKLNDDSLVYADIRFKTDTYSDLALSGDLEIFSQPLDITTSHTPELTNIGSFEKAWKLIKGEWWLSKQGNSEQYFSELFCEKLGKLLKMNMAEYRLIDNHIMSKDFTEQKWNFEPAASLVGDRTEEYALNYYALNNLSPLCAQQYLDILYLDAIVRNPDRHEYNYGVLRSQKNGNILGMAPNFDNNLSLISTGYPKILDRSRDRLISVFVDFLNQEHIHYDPPQFTELDLKKIIKDIPIDVDSRIIVEFLINGQESFCQMQKNYSLK